jgi:hypothetical protein
MIYKIIKIGNNFYASEIDDILDDRKITEQQIDNGNIVIFADDLECVKRELKISNIEIVDDEE